MSYCLYCNLRHEPGTDHWQRPCVRFICACWMTFKPKKTFAEVVAERRQARRAHRV